MGIEFGKRPTRHEIPPEMEEKFDDWMVHRSDAVKRLAEEFPLGTTFTWEDEEYFLLGWSENDQLIVSTIDPYANYPAALEAKEYFCASHLREALGGSINGHDGGRLH